MSAPSSTAPFFGFCQVREEVSQLLALMQECGSGIGVGLLFMVSDLRPSFSARQSD